MKKNCDVCKAKLPPNVLSLGTQPLCDDLKKIGSSKKNKLYKIELKLCKNCLTINQLHKVDQKILFPRKYNYRAALTKDVQKGMDDFTNKVSKLIKKKNKSVLDIGCNDGSLLNFFKKKGFKTFGIEPTNAHEDCSKNHKIFNEYFTKKSVTKVLSKNKFIDVVTFTNVFAHIPDFQELIKNLKLLLPNINYLVIENHYMGSIFEKNQFDTFYQEHPRTYSVKSFLTISKILGIKIQKIEFPKRYGGNIRVYMSNNHKKEFNTNELLKKEQKFIKNFKDLRDKIDIWKKNKSSVINDLIKNKYTIYGKAFPGRASILINLLKLDSNKLKCIFEQNNSPKNFHFVPGTKIPILPDKNIYKILNKKSIIINFSWHISKEIKKYLQKMKIKNKVINIIENKDFIRN
jgi:SAM-dependent methyltransferase